MFQNLISNAIKFGKANNLVKIEIAAEKTEAGWKFIVKDNGIGIDSRYKDKIFKIFQTLHNRDKYEGTGIGLAHCLKIVRLHDGNIWFDSELNGGTIFQFTISDNLKSV